MRYLWALIQFYFGKDRAFARTIHNVTGVMPVELEIYRLAFRHSSIANDSFKLSLSADCNERLEYLGDSILGAVVAEYLYKRYPTKSEGYLTEMRSKIVGRNSLNVIGMKLGLEKILESNIKAGHLHRSYAGNTLEALVGAIYLDQGYTRTKKFILRRLLTPHFDLKELEDQNLNFKSQLLEYLQKNKFPMPYFVLVEEKNHGAIKEFIVDCKVAHLTIGTSSDSKKKNAEQKAAEQGLINLHLLDELKNSQTIEAIDENPEDNFSE